MLKKSNLWWIWTISNVFLSGLFVFSLYSDVWEALISLS